METQIVPTTEPMPNAQEPAMYNAMLNNKLRDAAIIALLEDYAKFLMKKGIADNVDSMKAAIGNICSPAIDRGIITQSVIDHVFNNIDKRATTAPATLRMEKHCKKFMKHVLVEEMAEVLDASVPEQDAALFKEAVVLHNKLNEVVTELSNKYGAVAQQHACAFFNEFKNLFDPAFAECVQFICK